MVCWDGVGVCYDVVSHSHGLEKVVAMEIIGITVQGVWFPSCRM